MVFVGRRHRAEEDCMGELGFNLLSTKGKKGV